VAAEYQEHFGEHAYDDEGNYIGTDTTEAQEAWAEYFETGADAPAAEGAAEVADAGVEGEVAEAPAEAEAETPAEPEAGPEAESEG
jgi:small subunit ribosomal protein S1